MKKIILIFFIIATAIAQAALNGKAVKVTADKKSVAVGTGETVAIIAQFKDGVNTGTDVKFTFTQLVDITITKEITITSNNGISDWNADLTNLKSEWYRLKVIIGDGFVAKLVGHIIEVAVVDIEKIEVDLSHFGIVWKNAEGIELIKNDPNAPVVERNYLFRIRVTPEDAPFPATFRNVYLYSKPQDSITTENTGTGPLNVAQYTVPSKIGFQTAGQYEVRAECGTTIKTATININFGNAINFSEFFETTEVASKLYEHTLQGTLFVTKAQTGADIVYGTDQYRIAFFKADGTQSFSNWEILQDLAGNKPARTINDIPLILMNDVPNMPFVWQKEEDIQIEYKDGAANIFDDQQNYILHREVQYDLGVPLSVQIIKPTIWKHFDSIQENGVVLKKGTVPAIVDSLSTDENVDLIDINAQARIELSLMNLNNVEVGPDTDYLPPASPNNGGTKWYGIFHGVGKTIRTYDSYSWDKDGTSLKNIGGPLVVTDEEPILDFSAQGADTEPEAENNPPN